MYKLFTVQRLSGTSRDQKLAYTLHPKLCTTALGRRHTEKGVPPSDAYRNVSSQDTAPCALGRLSLLPGPLRLQHLLRTQFLHFPRSSRCSGQAAKGYGHRGPNKHIPMTRKREFSFRELIAALASCWRSSSCQPT